MTDDAPDMKVRMPAGLRARIKEAAKETGRSLNAEIRMRLEWSFAAESDFERHDAEADARSRLAAQRVLAANLSGMADPVEDRFRAIEKNVAAMERRLKALEDR